MKKQLVSITIYAVVFLALTVLLTRNYKVENKIFSASKVKIMVINEDGQNEFIDGFLNYLKQYAVFVEPKEDKEARKNDLFFKNVVYILTIPKGFTQEFSNGGILNLGKDAVPDSADAISIDNAVNNYLNIASTYIKHVPDISYTQLNNLINDSINEHTAVTVETKTQDEVTYSNSFNNIFFNYLGYIMIACFVSGVSIVMFSFRALDIRRKHTAAPLPGKNINMQLILANMVYVLCYMILFIVAGFILNRSRMLNVNTWLTWLNAIIFALTALSFSYLIGITVNSKKAVQAIATAVSLSIAFTSGVFVPQELIAAPVLRAASFEPAYWYVKANDAISQITSINWSQVSKIFGYMGIQIGFAVAILSIALVVSKRKAQQE
jgi:ABC-2 type transport system permease protein